MRLWNWLRPQRTITPLPNTRQLEEKKLGHVSAAIYSQDAEPSVAGVEKLVDDLSPPSSPLAIFEALELRVQRGKDISGLLGALSSEADADTFRENWVKNAPSGWLAPILTVLRSVPHRETDEKWLSKLELLLVDWGRYKPEDWDQILALAQEKELRPLVLGIFSDGIEDYADPQVLSLLQPIMAHLREMSEDEIISLMRGISWIKSPESLILLDQIDRYITEEMQEARMWLPIYKGHVQENED